MGFTDETVRFNLDDGSKDEISNTLTNVYRSLAEKGYNPINQIVGYVLSGDPVMFRVIMTPVTRFVNTNVMKSLKNSFAIILKEMELTSNGVMGLDVGSKTVGVAISDPSVLQPKALKLSKLTRRLKSLVSTD